MNASQEHNGWKMTDTKYTVYDSIYTEFKKIQNESFVWGCMLRWENYKQT